MNNNLKELLDDVLLAMERLNNSFQEQVTRLRQEGVEEKEVTALLKGVMAMRDASGIYMAWANHYIERFGQEEKGNPLDEAEEEGP